MGHIPPPCLSSACIPTPCLYPCIHPSIPACFPKSYLHPCILPPSLHPACIPAPCLHPHIHPSTLEQALRASPLANLQRLNHIFTARL